jgi:protein-disulfide isomerase
MAETGNGSSIGGIDRRWLIGGAALAVAGIAAYRLLGASSSRGQGVSVPLEKLMGAGLGPEISFGKPDAPVTIVEYASLTCGHCAAFHNDVFPKLEEKYIRTGQVRLILREYPIDTLALFAAMLGRCAGPEKGPGLIGAMFKSQPAWAVNEPGKPATELLKLWEGKGLAKAEFQACAENVELRGKIVEVRARGKALGVGGTPTFFINGVMLDGPTDTIATFDAALQPLLKR